MLCIVAQSDSLSCPTLCGPVDFNLPGSSLHGHSPGKNIGVGCHALLQAIFPTQGWNPGLLHCRQILYHLSHQGSPRVLEWVAYPFSRGSFQPRNPTGVSCIAGRFFTDWVTRDAKSSRIQQCVFFNVYTFFPTWQSSNYLKHQLLTKCRLNNFGHGIFYLTMMESIEWAFLGKYICYIFDGVFDFYFSCGSAGKESACNAGDLGSIPGLGRSLEKGKATHSSILAWRILWTSPQITKSWTRLSEYFFSYFFLDLYKFLSEIPHYFLFLNFFIGFCYTSTWITHRNTCVSSLLNLPPTSHPIPSPYVVTEHGAWAPCIIQQIPSGHLFYMY